MQWRERDVLLEPSHDALHRLRAYAGQGPFPGADRAYERALALPFHTRLEDDEFDRVVGVLDAVVSK